MKGFFSSSTLQQSTKPTSMTPQCGACGLFKNCITPKMQVTGEGKEQILIVGEAPGKTEDQEGEQFIGESGQLLRAELGKLNIDIDEDCWKENALRCRPPNNATPTAEQIRFCLPNVKQTIKELNPRIIIPMGAAATTAVLEPLYAVGGDPMEKFVGWKIPSQAHNAWICPVNHPTYILRTKATANAAVVALLWREQLRQAVYAEGRPWAVVPDFRKQVRCIYSPEEAAKAIHWMIGKGGTVSFDFECNALKPETIGAAIYSCAVCWEGERTIAYPFHGEAKAATRELLRSPLLKIGCNLSYEERWARVHLGTSVRNWVFDTVIGAHVLDNRKGITGLKFQAMVRLGQPIYNEHIERSFESVNPITKLNDINNISIDDLLLYNGLDALLTYKIGVQMMEELGIELQN